MEKESKEDKKIRQDSERLGIEMRKRPDLFDVDNLVLPQNKKELDEQLKRIPWQQKDVTANKLSKLKEFYRNKK